MASNDLKLMVDYCLNNPQVLGALAKFNCLDVKTTIECGYQQHADDPTLVWQGTVDQDRILLTRDYNTINEYKFAPCHHGGVIIIKNPRISGDIVESYMKQFLQSGIRKYAKHHVSHLSKDGAKIVTHDKQPVIADYKTGRTSGQATTWKGKPNRSTSKRSKKSR